MEQDQKHQISAYSLGKITKVGLIEGAGQLAGDLRKRLSQKVPGTQGGLLSGVWNDFQDRWPAILADVRDWTDSPRFRIGGIFVLVLSIGFQLLPTPQVVPAIAVSGTAILARDLIVSGRITRIRRGEIVLEAKGGVIYLIQPGPGQALGSLAMGMEVTAVLLPYRKGADGSVQARCKAIERKGM